jgi:putative acetyltransferase
MLEHTPTFTLGRSSHPENILQTPAHLAELGIDVVEVDRGGDVTYHGPGQLVVYPVLRLDDWQRSVQWYLRTLEDVIIAVLDGYGIKGERMSEFTGVWVNGAKVAAIGIGVHQWVSYHGISINLNPDLRHWQMIVPCGIPDKPITTLNALLDTPPSMPELMDAFEDAFFRIFDAKSTLSPDRKPSIQIKQDDLSGPEIAALLREHLHGMTLHSPPESIHALDLDALKKPGITFWTAWDGPELLGCGALKEIDQFHAEIKSMRTATQHLKKGVASTLLNHIIDEASKHGYTRLSLETGSMDAFLPARTLYAKYGFTDCEPFAGYILDPNSTFMTKEL